MEMRLLFLGMGTFIPIIVDTGAVFVYTLAMLTKNTVLRDNAINVR